MTSLRSTFAAVDEQLPLTRAGSTLTVLCVVAYAVGRQLGWIELMVLGAGCLFALLLAAPFVLGRLRLTVTRSLTPGRVAVGEPAVATLRITNPTKFPLGARLVEDLINGQRFLVDASELAPGASTEIVHTLPTTRRGIVDVGPAIVAKADPLGLMRREVRQAEADRLWVHPRVAMVYPVPVGFAKDFEGPTSDSSPAGDVSFHALRDYEIGDDHRHVHWLSTARTGQLMIRHYVDNRLPHLTVLLDDRTTSHGTDGFETAVEVAASLTVSTMVQRQPIALVVGSGPVLGRTVAGTTEHVLDALTLVATSNSNDLESQLLATLTVETETSVLAVVTGPRPADELLRLIAATARDIHVIIVRVWDNDVDRVPLSIPGATMFDVSSLEQFRSAWNRAMS